MTDTPAGVPVTGPITVPASPVPALVEQAVRYAITFGFGALASQLYHDAALTGAALAAGGAMAALVPPVLAYLWGAAASLRPWRRAKAMAAKLPDHVAQIR